jgi:hypothetical protein
VAYQPRHGVFGWDSVLRGQRLPDGPLRTAQVLRFAGGGRLAFWSTRQHLSSRRDAGIRLPPCSGSVVYRGILHWGQQRLQIARQLDEHLLCHHSVQPGPLPGTGFDGGQPLTSFTLTASTGQFHQGQYRLPPLSFTPGEFLQEMQLFGLRQSGVQLRQAFYPPGFGLLRRGRAAVGTQARQRSPDGGQFSGWFLFQPEALHLSGVVVAALVNEILKIEE